MRITFVMQAAVFGHRAAQLARAVADGEDVEDAEDRTYWLARDAATAAVQSMGEGA